MPSRPEDHPKRMLSVRRCAIQTRRSPKTYALSPKMCPPDPKIILRAGRCRRAECAIVLANDGTVTKTSTAINHNQLQHIPHPIRFSTPSARYRSIRTPPPLFTIRITVNHLAGLTPNRDVTRCSGWLCCVSMISKNSNPVSESRSLLTRGRSGQDL